LVEVLLAQPELLGESLAFGGGNCRHAPKSSRTLAFVKRSARTKL
jgi:hypothetical protein